MQTRPNRISTTISPLKQFWTETRSNQLRTNATDKKASYLQTDLRTLPSTRPTPTPPSARPCLPYLRFRRDGSFPGCSNWSIDWTTHGCRWQGCYANERRICTWHKMSYSTRMAPQRAGSIAPLIYWLSQPAEHGGSWWVVAGLYRNNWSHFANQ